MRTKSQKHNKLKLIAVDFFCGAGGVTRGFLDAGIDVICGIDNDPKAKETYELNNIRNNGNNVNFIEKDINILEFDELSDIINSDKYDKLIFVGCAPCQPFTKINTIRTKRENEKNYLLRFAEFIEYYRPDYLFIENVPGITAKKYGDIFKLFKNKLDELSYCFKDKDVNAKNYGIPQNRIRRILIASLNGYIDFPVESHGRKGNSYLTVRDILNKNKLNPLQPGETDPADPLHKAAGLSPDNLWRIKNTPKDGGGREIWMKERPVACFQKQKGTYKDVYSRMYWNKPAPTITTRFNSLSNGRFGHPEENRAISLREGALFQTFPLEYRFIGSSVIISKHIGNAVPVKLAEIFGNHLKRIAEKEYCQPSLWNKGVP